MIGQFSGLCFAVRPAKFESLLTPPSLSLSVWTQRYAKYLTNLASLVRTVSYGISRFQLGFTPKNCLMLLVTKSCLYWSVLHLISWEAAASFLYQWQEKAKQAQSFTAILFNSWFKIAIVTAELFVCSSDSILTRISQEIIRMMMSSSM